MSLVGKWVAVTPLWRNLRRTMTTACLETMTKWGLKHPSLKNSIGRTVLLPQPALVLPWSPTCAIIAIVEIIGSLWRKKMSDKRLFIERRAEGDYAVRKADSDRASAVCPTQAKAIEKAKKLNPDAVLHVERVRQSSKGKRDKWRKI